MDKRRKAVILTKIPLNQAEFIQYGYGIRRALSSMFKYGDLRVENLSKEDNELVLGILVGLPYLNDENIKYLNEKLGMTLPTWEETKKYNESLKIL